MSLIDMLKCVSVMSLITVIGVALIVRFSNLRINREEPNERD